MSLTRPLTLALCGLLFGATAGHAQPEALDLSFNSTGYVVRPVNTGDNLQKLLVQPDDKIIAVGMSFDATFTARAHVLRFNPDGTPDNDFATDGLFTYELDNEALLHSAVLTPEGKILLAGATTDYQTYRMLLIQLNADGSIDTSFGNDGVVTQAVGLSPNNGEDIAYDVAFDTEGNILLCGKSYDATYVSRPVVVRFTPSGALDTTFGVDGVATIPVNEVGASAFKAIVVQPDGKIVATGYFGQSQFWYLFVVVRFNADGTLDETFSGDGVKKYSYSDVDDSGEDMVISEDGSIIIAGRTTDANYNISTLLIKFTADGEVDATFGVEGAVSEDIGQFDYGWELEELENGEIVMAGTAGNGPPTDFNMAIWKYAANGTPLSTWGTDGLVQHIIPTYSTMIYGMAVQADGKILVGGQARTEVNQNYFFIARLGNNTIDGIADRTVNDAAVLMPNPIAAGNLLVVGTAEPVGQDARVTLYAADGRVVFTQQVRSAVDQQGNVALELPAGLKPGAYVLTVADGGRRYTAKLMVQ